MLQTAAKICIYLFISSELFNKNYLPLGQKSGLVLFENVLQSAHSALVQ